MVLCSDAWVVERIAGDIERATLDGAAENACRSSAASRTAEMHASCGRSACAVWRERR